MPEITPKQAYDMIIKRLSVFSSVKIDPQKIINSEDIKLLFQTIRKTWSAVITFRIFIKEFLKRGFISNGTIKFNPYIEKDILKTISEIISEKPQVFNKLKELRKICEAKPQRFHVFQNIISEIYEKKTISESLKIFEDNNAAFALLAQKDVLKHSPSGTGDQIIWALDPEIASVFNKIKGRVSFIPKFYLDRVICEENANDFQNPDRNKILDVLERFIVSNPEYKSQLLIIIHVIKDEHIPLIKRIEDEENFGIDSDYYAKMNRILEEILKFLYELSKEPFKYKNQDELFAIFRYTWLDNKELSYYFSLKDSFNRTVRNLDENQKFFHAYVSAIETIIAKIGKHFRYNNILSVGSKDLLNDEKSALNAARYYYEEEKYQESTQELGKLIEEKLRSYIANILELKFSTTWEEYLPAFTKEKIKNGRDKEKKNYGHTLPKARENPLHYLSRGEYRSIILDNGLWNSCFKKILGNMNRDMIEKLGNIATISHLDKHNRDESDLKEVNIQIKLNLENCKNIVELINKSYLRLLDDDLFDVNDQKVTFFYRKDNPAKNFPIEFTTKQLSDFFGLIDDFLKRENRFRSNFIDLEDRSRIFSNFSLPYPQFYSINLHYKLIFLKVYMN